MLAAETDVGVDGSVICGRERMRILSQAIEIANGAEVGVRDLTTVTNCSSHVTVTAPCPLQVNLCRLHSSPRKRDS